MGDTNMRFRKVIDLKVRGEKRMLMGFPQDVLLNTVFDCMGGLIVSFGDKINE
jgi:hypothetical protein